MQMHRVVHKKSQPSHASNASAMPRPSEPTGGRRGGTGAMFPWIEAKPSSITRPLTAACPLHSGFSDLLRPRMQCILDFWRCWCCYCNTLARARKALIPLCPWLHYKMPLNWKKKGKPAFLTTQSGEWNWSTHWRRIIIWTLPVSCDSDESWMSDLWEKKARWVIRYSHSLL